MKVENKLRIKNVIISNNNKVINNQLVIKRNKEKRITHKENIIL